MVKKAKKREIDGLTCSSPLRERSPYFNFSDVYFSEFIIIIIRSDSSLDIKKIDELSGKTVAVQKGNELYSSLLKLYPAIKVIEADSEVESAKMVLERKADASLSATSTYKSLHKNFLQSVKVGYVATERPSDLVFSVRKDWPELISVINKCLAFIPPETFSSFYSRWFGFSPPTEKTDLVLSSEEMSFLKEHPLIKLSFDADWPPFEFIDSHGDYHGIVAEYVKLFEQRLGIRFEFSHEKTWAEIVEKIKQKKTDMCAALLKTSQREKYLNFTSPYLSFPMVIVTTDKITFVDGVKDLKGKTVAVVKGFSIHEILNEKHPEIELHSFPNISEALMSVSKNKIFAYAGNLASVSHIVRREGLTNLKISGEMPYRFDISMGIRNDWPEFAVILQKALDSVSQKEQDAIIRKWITLQYEHKLDYSVIWKMSAIGIFILFIILYWSPQTGG